MKNRKAFTLAETMIVIVVLGIIATLTIPALVNKNKESVAKTKVRKAMAAYESALNKMIIENDLKSDDTLTAWAGANCANSTNYFKKVQGDGCIFKTSDGIWWNISDIERPLIAFKQDDLDQTKANAENDMSAFVLVGRFGTDGSLRVDDLAYETANDTANSKAQVEKLYNLLGMKSTGAGGGNQSPFAACNGAETCVVDGITYTKVTLTDYSRTYRYCAPEDWETEYGCSNFKTGTSTSTAGDYWIAILGYPDDYSTQAQNLEGSSCQWCIDNNGPDYYNAAKRHCGPNGQLATIAQLKSLASQGKLPSSPDINYFWASDEHTPDSAYYVDETGEVDNNSRSDSSGQVLCVGK